MKETKRNNKIEESDEFENDYEEEQTGAKKKKGKAIGLLFLTGAIVAGSIFGTKAFYSHQETKRAQELIANYKVEDYAILPSNVVTNRSYDITYASGEKITKTLLEQGINCVCINGTYYTPDGSNMAILEYQVTYAEQTDTIKVTTDGQTIYMAPNGYSLYGDNSIKFTTETVKKIVPVSTSYDYVTFPGSSAVEMTKEPQIISTLPYYMIDASTLICDVPDGATLNENDECNATLTLVPKKH